MIHNRATLVAKGFALGIVLSAAAPVAAGEPLTLNRVDAGNLLLTRQDTATADIWLSSDTALDEGDTLVAEASGAATLTVAAPAINRSYVIVVMDGVAPQVVGERVLPLQQASNFRDIGCYATRDGRTVRWGKAFRSGAMPLLTEDDYLLLEQLKLSTVVDFRSLEERELAPDQLDDRTGALFLSNDYSMTAMMKDFAANGGMSGENLYLGIEKRIAPQLRSMFNRLIADEGAVVYHCSAGQDRTGVATALNYDVLGVDRETILADYHLSTSLRRTEFEMPEVDPAEHPNNPILRYYTRDKDGKAPPAQPLYTASGASHLAQFFTYLDATYGGSEGYLTQELAFTPEQIARLREILLQPVTGE